MHCILPEHLGIRVPRRAPLASRPIFFVTTHAYRKLTNNDNVKDLSAEALAFYENGEEIRTYNVGDLISKELTWNFGAYGWLKGFSFDDERNTLSLTLVNGERYRFDIKNGEITRIERNPKKLPAWKTSFACLAQAIRQ